MAETDDVRESCRDRALKLLGARAHSTAELRRKLSVRHYPAPVVDEILRDLTRLGLLDDRAFARDYCELRTQGSGAVGRYRLRLELQERGIASEIVADTLSAIAEAPEAEDAEFARALDVGQRKWRTVSGGPDPRAARAKVYRLLASRGFGADVCRRVLDHLRDAEV